MFINEEQYSSEIISNKEQYLSKIISGWKNWLIISIGLINMVHGSHFYVLKYFTFCIMVGDLCIFKFLIMWTLIMLLLNEYYKMT